MLGLSLIHISSPVCSVFIVPGIVLIILYWILSTPQRRVRREMKRKWKDPTYAFRLAHMEGLRLAQGTSCVAHYEKGMVEIQGGGVRFQLDIGKIMKAEVRTETEIQKAYVSSIGGAVSGAMVFGALGAIIGGRVKEPVSYTHLDVYKRQAGDSRGGSSPGTGMGKAAAGAKNACDCRN